MDIKTIFKDASEEQIEAFKKALGEQYVPNDVYRKKVDSLQAELTGTSDKLTESQNTITELSEKMKSFNPDQIDDYKSQIEKLNADIETFKNDSTKREQNITAKHDLKDLFRNAKANNDALDFLVDLVDLDKVSRGEDGKISNFEDLLKPIQESRKGLFGTESTDTKPPAGGGGDADTADADFRKALGLPAAN